MKNVKNYRQGDVMLFYIDNLPKGAKKIKKRPLALGEQTGHSHRATGKGYDMYEYEGKTYLQVYDDTPLIHEEHNQHIILPGVYEQVQEREYSYEDEELKKVID